MNTMQFNLMRIDEQRDVAYDVLQDSVYQEWVRELGQEVLLQYRECVGDEGVDHALDDQLLANMSISPDLIGLPMKEMVSAMNESTLRVEEPDGHAYLSLGTISTELVENGQVVQSTILDEVDDTFISPATYPISYTQDMTIVSHKNVEIRLPPATSAMYDYLETFVRGRPLVLEMGFSYFLDAASMFYRRRGRDHYLIGPGWNFGVGEKRVYRKIPPEGIDIFCEVGIGTVLVRVYPTPILRFMTDHTLFAYTFPGCYPIVLDPGRKGTCPQKTKMPRVWSTMSVGRQLASYWYPVGWDNPDPYSGVTNYGYPRLSFPGFPVGVFGSQCHPVLYQDDFLTAPLLVANTQASGSFFVLLGETLAVSFSYRNVIWSPILWPQYLALIQGMMAYPDDIVRLILRTILMLKLAAVRIPVDKYIVPPFFPSIATISSPMIGPICAQRCQRALGEKCVVDPLPQGLTPDVAPVHAGWHPGIVASTCVPKDPQPLSWVKFAGGVASVELLTHYLSDDKMVPLNMFGFIDNRWLVFFCQYLGGFPMKVQHYSGSQGEALFHSRYKGHQQTLSSFFTGPEAGAFPLAQHWGRRPPDRYDSSDDSDMGQDDAGVWREIDDWDHEQEAVVMEVVSSFNNDDKE